MKEITRIHLAKTPYNIEKAAEKALADYDAAIRASLSADEAEAIMPDLEIRMVELLEERGIQAEGVISLRDVEALQERLGAPADFQEDDGAVPEKATGASQAKRLYRDIDNAMIGGVAAGFAAYFHIDRVWVRLAFVLLTFASFGTGVLLYIVLWVITPPARTTSEKLQMQGEPVTVENLKEHGAVAIENLKAQKHFVEHGRRVAALLGAILLAIGAFVSFVLTVMGTVGMLAFIQSYHVESFVAYVSLSLFTLAGLLLTVLLSGLAATLFGRKLRKYERGALVGVTIVGALSFFAAAVVAWLAFGTIRPS